MWLTVCSIVVVHRCILHCIMNYAKKSMLLEFVLLIKHFLYSTPVIMISAYPDREFHRLSIEAGAVAFLDKKDLDARTLRQVVEDWRTN